MRNNICIFCGEKIKTFGHGQAIRISGGAIAHFKTCYQYYLEKKRQKKEQVETVSQKHRITSIAVQQNRIRKTWVRAGILKTESGISLKQWDTMSCDPQVVKASLTL